MNDALKILILDDNDSDAALIEQHLKTSELVFVLSHAHNRKEFISEMKSFIPDIILCDYQMPAYSGFAAYVDVKDTGMNFPFIIISGTLTDETAAEFIRIGVDDYLLKDRLSRLPKAITNALEKKRIENEKQKYVTELAASEKKFRALIEHSNDSIVLLDEDHKIVYRSPSGEKISGWTTKEALKLNLMQQFHPGDKDNLKKIFNNALVNPGHPFNITCRIKHKEGYYLWIEGTLTNLLEDENVNAYIINFRDISERVASEKKLKQTEQLLSEAQQLAKIGNWNIDMQTNEVFWSDGIWEIAGVDKTVIPGLESFMFFVYPADKDRVITEITRVQQTGESAETFYRIIKKDGEVRTIYSTIYLKKDDNGTPLRLYGTLQDVTEQKNAEHELQHMNEQLRQLSSHLQTIREEERAHIAREIHDELGQLLTAIKMDVSWLNKNNLVNDGSVKEKFAGMLTLIDSTINSVRKIATELRPGILDKLGLVAAIEWYTFEFAKRSGITIKCICCTEPVIPPDVSIGLFRILQESLTNIARHAKADNAAVLLEHKNGKLCLSITDNGKGFDTTQGEKRTLGLLGMKERAVMIGGKFELNSKPGKGTAVVICIPLN